MSAPREGMRGKHFLLTVLEDGREVREQRVHDPFVTVRVVTGRPTLADWFWGRGRNVLVMVRGDDAAHDLIYGAADPRGWTVPDAPPDVLRQEKRAARDVSRGTLPPATTVAPEPFTEKGKAAAGEREGLGPPPQQVNPAPDSPLDWNPRIPRPIPPPPAPPTQGDPGSPWRSG